MNVKKRAVACAATMLVAGIILSGCSKPEQPAEPTATQPPKTEAPAQPATPPPAQTKPTSPTTSGSTAPASTAPTRSYVKELLAPAKLKEKAPETYKVKFDTTRGEFTVTVTRAWAPLGADRFYNLVKHHFY